MALVRSKLLALGLHKSSVEFSLNAKRRSTNQLYNLRWRAWATFALSKGIKPLYPSTQDLANFLVEVYQKKSLSSKTLLGYKSAITSTIAAATGRRPEHLISSSLIANILSGISNAAVSKPRVSFPKWDVFLVLKLLRSNEFEPLAGISIKLLTFKTVFLIALATCRRLSGIQALSGLDFDIEFTTHQVTLSFLPDFRAKNQNASELSKPVVIQALAPTLEHDDPDRFLCPVRALRVYLDRTRSFRASKRSLFVSLNPKYQSDISRQTLARWLTSLIKQAYVHAQVDVVPDIRAHEIRAIGSSLAHVRGASLQSIMAVAFWKTPATFINHYMRDFSSLRLDQSYGIAKAVVASMVTSV